MARRRSAAPLTDLIVDAALDEAERSGWPSLRLHRVAARLGVALPELHTQFRDAEAIAEAWLARGDRAMLALGGRSFLTLPAPERVERAILAWLDALAPHRAVTRQILLGKLYPGHPHHVIGLVLRLSRTVQWLREAARLDAPPPQRQIEEIGLTWLFAATVALWAADRSADQARTRRFLAARLRHADWLMARIVPALKRASPQRERRSSSAL
jgi:ubiquinone biosynthesis protein COQ9